MIIDLILDRKDGEPYNAKRFYNECMEYNAIFTGIADKITAAMDYGTEKQVKAALCEYVIKNEYNPDTCDFINGCQWLVDDTPAESNAYLASDISNKI